MSHKIKSFLAISALALAVPLATHANSGGDPSVVSINEDTRQCEGMKHGGHYTHGKDGHQHGKVGYKHGNRAERMFDKLELTPEQRTKARAIMDQHHEKMKAERLAMMKEMDTILTPEQREKANAMKQKYRDHKEAK
jgi:Spy/CpxP family protein refolding chaperone